VDTFSDADLERFRKAQKILSEQFEPPPTIAQLAGMLATNETKLKTGFKCLYGMTIFEFRHRRRMQLSLENSWKVPIYRWVLWRNGSATSTKRHSQPLLNPSTGFARRTSADCTSPPDAIQSIFAGKRFQTLCCGDNVAPGAGPFPNL
jgi:hypothetical protein